MRLLETEDVLGCMIFVFSGSPDVALGGGDTPFLMDFLSFS